MHEERWRVLLVEDDVDVAAGLGDWLDRHGVDVDFAYSAAQARTRLQAAAFDVCVLDVNLPGEDGIALCRDLKHGQGLPAPVIFLTARGALDDKLRGFDAGAVDWIVKPFAPAELLARIRAVGSHQQARAAAATLNAGAYSLDAGSGLLRHRGRSLQLHASGLALLRRLLQAAPGAVSRERLADGLWGDEPPGTDALRAHVYQLRQAIAEAFGTRPIVTERGLGYRFDADADADTGDRA